jgi:hypothetical protein
VNNTIINLAAAVKFSNRIPITLYHFRLVMSSSLGHPNNLRIKSEVQGGPTIENHSVKVILVKHQSPNFVVELGAGRIFSIGT